MQAHTQTRSDTVIVSTDAVRQVKRMLSEDFYWESAFTCLVPLKQMLVGEKRMQSMKGGGRTVRRKWGWTTATQASVIL